MPEVCVWTWSSAAAFSALRKRGKKGDVLVTNSAQFIYWRLFGSVKLYVEALEL